MKKLLVVLALAQGSLWASQPLTPQEKIYLAFVADCSTMTVAQFKELIKDCEGFYSLRTRLSGNTPLHMLVMNTTNTELLRHFLEEGADPHETNVKGHDAFVLAKDNELMLKVLTSYTPRSPQQKKLQDTLDDYLCKKKDELAAYGWSLVTPQRVVIAVGTVAGLACLYHLVATDSK